MTAIPSETSRDRSRLSRRLAGVLGFSVAAALLVPVSAAQAALTLQALPPECAQTIAQTSGGTQVTATCAFTGGLQEVTVPTGVHSVRTILYGASGGTNGEPNNVPSQGGFVQAVLPVVPGEVLSVVVGGAGVTNSTSRTYGGGGAGPAGGGSSGGGGSFVFAGPTLLVAAGGGGGSGSDVGGDGSGTSVATAGAGPDSGGGATNGNGGAGAGTGQAGSGPATSTSFSTTGGSAVPNSPLAGGGGGGWYGGGAAEVGGGGGGGGYVDSGATLTAAGTLARGPSIDGQVKFSWIQPPVLTMTTTPSAPAMGAGQSISDIAVLTYNGAAPSGSVSFALYPPSDPSCASAPMATVSGPVISGSLTTATSSPVTVSKAGTYHWVATYSDALYGTVRTACGEPNTVTAGPFAVLTLVPSPSTITYGQSQSYTATGADAYGNAVSLGTVTYTISGGGSCTVNVCTGVAGSYTVTGRSGTTTGTAALKIIKAATRTTVLASPSTPAVNQPVTFTAHVAPVAPATTTPTGTVSFYLDGSPTALVTVALVNGTASFATTLGAGAHSVIAVYNGDPNYLASQASSPASATVACTTTITGTHSGLVLTSGTTCIVNAHIIGGITLVRGAVLDIESSTVSGSISANRPGGLRICASHVGAMTVANATGYVRVGDPANGCASNTIAGGITLAHNNAGLTVIGNTIAGSVANIANTPATISGNHP